MFIDTHCHLNDEKFGDLDDVGEVVDRRATFEIQLERGIDNGSMTSFLDHSNTHIDIVSRPVKPFDNVD